MLRTVHIVHTWREVVVVGGGPVADQLLEVHVWYQPRVHPLVRHLIEHRPQNPEVIRAMQLDESPQLAAWTVRNLRLCGSMVDTARGSNSMPGVSGER